MTDEEIKIQIEDIDNKIRELNALADREEVFQLALKVLV